MNLFRTSVVSVLSMVALSASAFADDASAQKSFESAKALYAQRSATSMKAVDDALSELAKAEGQAQGTELKYDILVLESRALHDRGYVPGGLLEFGECEPAIGFPDGANVAQCLVLVG